jgi:hypothetical protein
MSKHNLKQLIREFEPQFKELSNIINKLEQQLKDKNKENEELNIIINKLERS